MKPYLVGIALALAGVVMILTVATCSVEDDYGTDSTRDPFFGQEGDGFTALSIPTEPPTTAAPARNTPRVTRSRTAPRPADPGRRAGAAPEPIRHVGGVWEALARCESGMRNVNTGNGYYGFFQFALGTWRSLGMSGLPSDHPWSTQLAAAQRLQQRSGWGQWPACARKLGLR